MRGRSWIVPAVTRLPDCFFAIRSGPPGQHTDDDPEGEPLGTRHADLKPSVIGEFCVPILMMA